MFSARPTTEPWSLIRRARELAPDDEEGRAAVAAKWVCRCRPVRPPRRRRHALEVARSSGDTVLESAALDALIASQLRSDVVAAHRTATARLQRLHAWRDDPAQGLELKDALHVAAFTALGAGDLRAAMECRRLVAHDADPA